jgi:hypothetical protein
LTDLIDGHIEVKKQSALLLVSDHALNPEEGSKPGTARHRCYMVQTARRIQDHLPSRELHGMRAIQIVNHELTAIIFVRLTEEECH